MATNWTKSHMGKNRGAETLEYIFFFVETCTWHIFWNTQRWVGRQIRSARQKGLTPSHHSLACTESVKVLSSASSLTLYKFSVIYIQLLVTISAKPSSNLLQFDWNTRTHVAFEVPFWRDSIICLVQYKNAKLRWGSILHMSSH